MQRCPFPTQHQWCHGAASEEHQVTWCSHYRGPLLDNQHQLTGQESSAVPALTLMAEEGAPHSTHLHPTIESILTSCITIWYRNCHASKHRALQKVILTVERIISTSLPCLQDIFTSQCIHKATGIVADTSHPSNGLFTPSHLGEGSAASGTGLPDCTIDSFPN